MAAKKAWRKAYKKATGISAKSGVKRQQKTSGMSKPAAIKTLKKSSKTIMRGMQSTMKGTSSKKAVARTRKAVTARSGLTGKAATRQARRIVRGRKWANS